MGRTRHTQGLIGEETREAIADRGNTFSEATELKRRVRDIIEPGRDLGHADRKKASEAKDGATVVNMVRKSEEPQQGKVERGPDGTICEECQ
jgi:hypothetical protein